MTHRARHFPRASKKQGPSRCTGPAAMRLEQLLRQVRATPDSSREQARLSQQVLLEVQPFVASLARQLASRYPRTPAEDLEQEGLAEVAGAWRAFTPGQGGPGRTLYPAYVLRLARQAMDRLGTGEALTVKVTRWGKKAAPRAVFPSCALFPARTWSTRGTPGPRISAQGGRNQ